jgi:catechol 2,3-dioxygenase-like lactoylglutathione lyase family enzyme
MALKVQALDHLVAHVTDVEASAAWYQRVLGMTREYSPSAEGTFLRTAMKFGQQKINLRPVAASKEDWFTADHESAGSDDLCFLTASKPDEVVRHLEAEGVAIVTGFGERRGARGTLISVYCRDPDGSLIEIASYADS